MGRRRNRKLERRQKQGAGYGQAHYEPRPVQPEEYLSSVDDLSNPLFNRHGADEYGFIYAFNQNAQLKLKTCGGCREFVEDGEGGRGTCLHPGSGVLSPWTDTPGCDFHSKRR